MATANFFIDAEDGWTQVTSGDVDFIRIRSNTPKHAFFVTTGSTTPASSVIGYKVICDDFWVDVPTTTGEFYYVRLMENIPQETRIDVFYIATTTP
jgi:hypothetical protein